MALANLNHSRHVGSVLVRHGLLGLLDQLGLRDAALLEPDQHEGRRGARLGRRLSRALNDLGPTFVKLGQVLATREDMLPASIVSELAQLQDNAAPISLRQVRKQISVALGADVLERFAWFDDEPLAAASISQIHRARTHGGLQVVVKIRRPGIRKRIDNDIALLTSLVEMAVKRSPAIAKLAPLDFVEEFGRSLVEELDFEREAQSLYRMRQSLHGTARVPRPIPELSVGGVLTMEFVGGVKVSNVQGGKARQDVARKIVRCFATQFLRDEQFHGNPHPGNILVQADGELALVDFGSVGTLTPEMRHALLRLAGAAGSRDGKRTARAMRAMVHCPPDLDDEALIADMGEILQDLVNSSVGSVDATATTRRMFTVAQHHGLRFRAEYFHFFRSAMLVDGVLRSLDPSVDLIRATQAHLLRSFWQRKWLRPAVELTGVTTFNSLAQMSALKKFALGGALLALLTTPLLAC